MRDSPGTSQQNHVRSVAMELENVHARIDPEGLGLEGRGPSRHALALAQSPPPGDEVKEMHGMFVSHTTVGRAPS